MTIAERFDRFIPRRVRLDALRRQVKDLENDLEDDDSFIKEWFRDRPQKRRYRGIQYASVTYQRMDPKKARRLLGARAKEAEVTSIRETLTLDEEAQAVRDAGAQLKPLSQGERATA